MRERLAAVEARIRAAGGTGVDVLAVTKGFGADAIDAAVAAGCRRIGENYAQELLDKLRQRDESVPMPEIHFIGRLQSNKVRSLTGVVCVADGVVSFAVPCFTVLAVVLSTAAAGFCFADLESVVTGLLTVVEVGLSWA